MTLDLATITTRCRSLCRNDWFRRLLSVVIYVVLALATTWPLMLSPKTSLPMGSTRAVTVPLFNLWTIWWNADRAPEWFAGYWDAPIFHPTRDSFAFSETQLTSLIVAPVIWTTGSRALAYNVYLWLSLVLNGVAAESLLRTLRVRSWAALAGGCAMIMLPLVHWQIDVIQLAPIWGILWCWSACWRMTRMPESARWPTGILRGCEVGAAVSITFHACGHHGLFLGLLMAVTGWLLPRYWFDRRLWIALAASVGVLVITVAPFAVHMTRVMQAHNFVRTESLITSLSAMPQDYLNAFGDQLLGFGVEWARPAWTLSPGWVKVAFAACGAVLGVWRRRTRRFTLFLLAMIGVSFALSLGGNLRLGDWLIWPTLAKYVPGLGQVRNVFRFAFFTQIAVVILATQCVWWLWLRIRVCQLRRMSAAAITASTTQTTAARGVSKFARWRIAVWLGCVGLGALAAFEVRPYRIVLGDVPNEAANANWINFIKHQTPPGSGIVCLPFPKGYQCEDFAGTTRWMYYGTFHKVPMVNGYSGFFPLDYFSTQEALNAPQNYAAILSRLENEGVAFVVMAQESGSPEPARTATFGLMRLELVFADPCGVSVYRLRRLPPPALNS